MSKCEKHEKALGSRRANSPSWPCIETMPYLEAEYTCAVGTGARATGLAMRGSPYTVIAATLRFSPFNSLAGSLAVSIAPSTHRVLVVLRERGARGRLE